MNSINTLKFTPVTVSLPLSLTGEEGVRTLFTGQRVRERKRERDKKIGREKEREKLKEREREREM
jgi:hypothetical protein